MMDLALLLLLMYYACRKATFAPQNPLARLPRRRSVLANGCLKLLGIHSLELTATKSGEVSFRACMQ